MYTLSFYKQVINTHYGDDEDYYNNLKYFFPIYEELAKNAWEIFDKNIELNFERFQSMCDGKIIGCSISDILHLLTFQMPIIYK